MLKVTSHHKDDSRSLTPEPWEKGEKQKPALNIHPQMVLLEIQNPIRY